MKYNKIVFEGPNNVGKSTLIKKLKRLQNDLKLVEVEHVTEVCPNDYVFYEDLLSSSEPMIFDRLHLGEMIYSNIFGRECKLSPDEFDRLLTTHKDHTLIVIVDADYDFIIRATQAKQEFFDYNISKKERKEYYDMWQYLHPLESIGIKAIRIKNHWDEETTSELLGRLIEALA